MVEGGGMLSWGAHNYQAISRGGITFLKAQNSRMCVETDHLFHCGEKSVKTVSGH
jgi:hypothetical protein